MFTGFHGGTGIPTALNPLQQKLSDEMIALWVGTDEAGGGSGKWQPFEPDRENDLSLQLPAARMVKGEFRRRHHCGFWDGSGLY